jgi:hypothetical protein
VFALLFELSLILLYFKTGMCGAREWNGDKVRDIGAAWLVFLLFLLWVRRAAEREGDVIFFKFPCATIP